EICIENPDVKGEPDGVENVLHVNTVDTKSEKRVERFPGKIQRQRKERNCVGFVPESNANAVDVDDGPADTADHSKDQFQYLQCRHAESGIEMHLREDRAMRFMEPQPGAVATGSVPFAQANGIRKFRGFLRGASLSHLLTQM